MIGMEGTLRVIIIVIAGIVYGEMRKLAILKN